MQLEHFSLVTVLSFVNKDFYLKQTSAKINDTAWSWRSFSNLSRDRKNIFNSAFKLAELLGICCFYIRRSTEKPNFDESKAAQALRLITVSDSFSLLWA